jgi:hypothetical protein
MTEQPKPLELGQQPPPGPGQPGQPPPSGPINAIVSNILDHPKTSVAGTAIAVIAVCNVLSQQGITLGHAGTGTWVSLMLAMATAALGLVSKDPS